MTRLLLLAALAITASSAPSTLSAEDRAAPAARTGPGGGTAAALVDSQADRVDTAPASCPYHFASNMPAATFCVYRGTAFNRRREVCATDVVVIWSSFASQTAGSANPGYKESDSSREVYLAFVADSELVVRAIVDRGQGDRAEMVGYTLGSEEVVQPLTGRITRRAVGLGSADVLSIDLRQPRRFRRGTCELASYSGTFLGLLRAPSETVNALVPRQLAAKATGL